MRCIKCGFVSFDYLSECRKCGTSLAGVREQLGFSAAKPAAASLLESLLSDYSPAAAEEKTVAQTDISSPFEFDDEIGGGFRQVEEFSAGPGAVVPNPDEGEEDFSVLDISDEELELLMDKEPEGSAQTPPDLWLDLDSDKKAAEPPPATQPSMQTKSGEPEDTSDLIPRFDFNSLPGLADRTPRDAPPGPKTAFTEPEAWFESPQVPPGITPAPAEKAEDLSKQAAVPSDEVSDPSGESADDFVIELSETDLENLLQELETSRKTDDQEEDENRPPVSKD